MTQEEPIREVTGSPGAPVNDKRPTVFQAGIEATRAVRADIAGRAPADRVGWLVFLHEPDVEYRIYENKRDAETAAMERGEVAHAVYLAQEPPVAVAPVMPPQPKHDRSPMEDALYQARTMAAFFLQAYCPEGEELEAPDARSMAGYEYHRQRLIEAIERYAASTKPLAEALGSDQQGNRASQEPPVAGVRAWVPAEKRLPPPGVEVLVYGPMNLMRWGIDVVKNEGEFFYSSFPNEVSHWMPLPDPPAAPQQEQTP